MFGTIFWLEEIFNLIDSLIRRIFLVAAVDRKRLLQDGPVLLFRKGEKQGIIFNTFGSRPPNHTHFFGTIVRIFLLANDVTSEVVSVKSIVIVATVFVKGRAIYLVYFSLPLISISFT